MGCVASSLSLRSDPEGRRHFNHSATKAAAASPSSGNATGTDQVNPLIFLIFSFLSAAAETLNLDSQMTRHQGHVLERKKKKNDV